MPGQFKMPPHPPHHSSQEQEDTSAYSSYNPNSYTGENPEMPRFNAQGSSNDQPEHKRGFLSRFHPGKAALITFALIFSTSLIYERYEDHIYSSNIYTAVDASDYCEYEVFNPQMIGDKIYAPLKITKIDPYTQLISSVSVTATDTNTGQSLGSWYESADMDYDCKELWLTAVFDTDDLYIPDEWEDEEAGEDAVTAKIDLSDIDIQVQTDYIDAFPITEYSYLADDANATDEQLYKIYQNHHKEDRSTYTIDSGGIENQNGIVVFTIERPNAYEPDDSVYGTVNIIYKNNGEVVYAEPYHYSGTLSDYKYSCAFTPEEKVPAYDSVELINVWE